MQKNNKYTFSGRVRYSEVDHRRRLTLPGIINYFQDCSTFQSEDLGVGLKYCAEHKRAWVLSSWQIIIDRYPVMNEKIEISTWATDFNGLYGVRNFCIADEQGELAAYANSMWVYMDTEKGRPTRPDEQEVSLYGTGEPLKMEYASRKISLPKETQDGEAFPVRKCQIDTNEHVNNSQYVQMALEALPEAPEVRQLRVEYKKSAVYGDMIFPKLSYEPERTVVELCNECGKPYAVVEVK